MNKKWSEIPLGEVLKERKETPDESDMLSGKVRIVSKIGFDDGKIQLRETVQTKTKMILILPGDLVISGINAAKGAIAVYNEENKRPIAATIHYGAYISNKEKANVKYLWWLLRSNTFKELLNKYVPGGIKTELKANRLLQIPIPLPSLPEQRQIIEKIENIDRRIQTVKKLRQGNEQGIEFLYDSYASRIFNQNCMEKYKISIGESVRLKKLYLNKELRNPQYNRNLQEFSYLDISSVGHGPLVINEGKLTSNAEAPSRARRVIYENDIVFSTVRPNLKAIAKIGHALNGQICSTGFAVFTCSEEILSDFLLYQLCSAFIIKQCIEKTTGGHYPAINENNLKKVIIVLPPTDTQKNIIRKFDDLIKTVSETVQLYRDVYLKLNSIWPSVLEKVFNGKL